MITKNSIQHLLNHEGLRITVADVTDAAKEAGNIHNLSLFSEIIIGKILAATAALATAFQKSRRNLSEVGNAFAFGNYPG